MVVPILWGMTTATKRASLALALALAAGAPADAQQPSAATQRTTIAVSFNGDDAVGKQLAYAVREELSRSARYQLAEPTKTAAYGINLVSLDPDGKDGNRTVVAISITATNLYGLMGFLPDTFPKTSYMVVSPFLLDQSVLIVGSKRVAQTANEIVADMDTKIREELEKFK